MIKNCPIINKDVSNTKQIYSPDLQGIRCNTTRTRLDAIRTDYVSVSRDLISWNKQICLAANIIFVDSIPFLVTTSRNIQYITMEHIPNQTLSQLKQPLTCVIQLHGRVGFVAQTILVNGQFERLKGHLSNVVMNTTANSEHVREVKSCLQVIK